MVTGRGLLRQQLATALLGLGINGLYALHKIIGHSNPLA
jgi:hypothetical protein